MLFNELITEDLKQGDLEHLVKKIIEIDTYKPKLDDKNIVVAFFVKQENPAYDLARFIEFSDTKTILDTEVSDAPNHIGDYVVFVEISNVNVAEKIYNILKALKNLTKNDQWIAKAYGHKLVIKVK